MWLSSTIFKCDGEQKHSCFFREIYFRAAPLVFYGDLLLGLFLEKFHAFLGYLRAILIHFLYLDSCQKLQQREREICFIFNQINALTHLDQYCWHHHTNSKHLFYLLVCLIFIPLLFLFKVAALSGTDLPKDSRNFLWGKTNALFIELHLAKVKWVWLGEKSWNYMKPSFF